MQNVILSGKPVCTIPALLVDNGGDRLPTPQLNRAFVDDPWDTYILPIQLFYFNVLFVFLQKKAPHNRTLY
jgi:hypothetical protein